MTLLEQIASMQAGWVDPILIPDLLECIRKISEAADNPLFYVSPPIRAALDELHGKL